MRKQNPSNLCGRSIQAENPLKLDDVACYMSSRLTQTEERSTLSGEGKIRSTMAPPSQSSPKQAANEVIVKAIQVFEKKVEAGGKNFKVGMTNDAGNTSVSQHFKDDDVKTTGDFNVFGV